MHVSISVLDTCVWTPVCGYLHRPGEAVRSCEAGAMNCYEPPTFEARSPERALGTLLA